MFSGGSGPGNQWRLHCESGMGPLVEEKFGAKQKMVDGADKMSRRAHIVASRADSAGRSYKLEALFSYSRGCRKFSTA